MIGTAARGTCARERVDGGGGEARVERGTPVASRPRVAPRPARARVGVGVRGRPQAGERLPAADADLDEVLGAHVGQRGGVEVRRGVHPLVQVLEGPGPDDGLLCTPLAVGGLW